MGGMVGGVVRRANHSIRRGRRGRPEMRNEPVVPTVPEITSERTAAGVQRFFARPSSRSPGSAGRTPLRAPPLRA